MRDLRGHGCDLRRGIRTDEIDAPRYVVLNKVTSVARWIKTASELYR